MRNKFSKLALAATFGFALVFTFSCSSASDWNNGGSSSSSSSSVQCLQPFVWDGEKCSQCPTGYEYYKINSEPASCVVPCNSGYYRSGTDCKLDPNWCPDGTSKYKEVPSSCIPSSVNDVRNYLVTCISKINNALRNECVTLRVQDGIETECKKFNNTVTPRVNMRNIAVYVPGVSIDFCEK